MAGELIIRKATINDLNGLVEIEKACFDRPWSKESLAHDLDANPLALVLCAEINRRIAGYVDVWIIQEEGHINNVAVHPDFQRMHVGTILMHTLIHVTENKGVLSHTLEVARGNQAAISMYQKFGFQETGVREKYYENGDDALIMWRLGDPNDRTKES
jgi:ribosomal-protein-alanine N-acetyltransferase